MIRPLLAAGALALALPSIAFAQPAPAPADPSNPAGAPLSPTLDSRSQPARGDDSRVVRDAEAARDAEAMTGTAPTDAETEADRKAREEAAKPKPVRTVRMGEKTMSAKLVAQR